MAQQIEIMEIKDGKARIRYGKYEWEVEPGEMIKISTPDINVYDIRTDEDNGARYQGPIHLPSTRSI